jgi:hypothetical protein
MFISTCMYSKAECNSHRFFRLISMFRSPSGLLYIQGIACITTISLQVFGCPSDAAALEGTMKSSNFLFDSSPKAAKVAYLELAN